MRWRRSSKPSRPRSEMLLTHTVPDLSPDMSTLITYTLQRNVSSWEEKAPLTFTVWSSLIFHHDFNVRDIKCGAAKLWAGFRGRRCSALRACKFIWLWSGCCKMFSLHMWWSNISPHCFILIFKSGFCIGRIEMYLLPKHLLFPPSVSFLRIYFAYLWIETDCLICLCLMFWLCFTWRIKYDLST